MNSEERQIRYGQIIYSLANKLREKKPTVRSVSEAKNDALTEIISLKKEQTNDNDRAEVQEFFAAISELISLKSDRIDDTINQLISWYEQKSKDLNSRLLE